MKFQWPGEFIWLLVPLLILAGSRWDRRARKKAIEKFVGPFFAARIFPAGFSRRRTAKGILVLLALIFMCVALAGPRSGRKLREVTRRGSDVVICLDVSASMLAEDVAPNRITKAKRELSSFIEKLKGERVAIVAFAGAAFLQCPLTLDTDAATMYLNLLDPASFAVPGTDIGASIHLAAKVLSGESHSAIVLLTDGEDFGETTMEAAEEAGKKGIRIFSIGYGTPGGELIRIRDTSGKVVGFKKDDKGQMVVSHLNETLLKDIAQKTRGRYFPASNGDIEVDELAQEIEGMEKKDLGNEEISQLEHRFQIPLALAFFCLWLELLIPEKPGALKENVFSKKSTRRVAAATPLLLLILLSAPAMAGFRDDINEGNKKYRDAHWEEALASYRAAQTENPGSGIASYNIANVLYHQGKFTEALAELTHSTTTLKQPKLNGNAHYNRGNCLYRMDQQAAAIEEYEKALLANPNDEDAKFNIEYIKSGPKPPQKRPSPKDGKGGGENQPRPKDGKTGQAPQKDSSSSKDSPESLSKEDAERILRTISEQEQQMFQSKPSKQLPEQSPKGKDW